MSTKYPNNISQVKLISALLTGPALLYLSGAFVVIRVLYLAGVKPMWSDFAFFHTLNQGLSIFTVTGMEMLWFFAITIAMSLPFFLKKVPFYFSLISTSVLLLIIGFCTANAVAHEKVVNAQPIKFQFESSQNISEAVRLSNQNNQLRLIYIFSNQYLVTDKLPSGHLDNGFRIADNDITSCTLSN